MLVSWCSKLSCCLGCPHLILQSLVWVTATPYFQSSILLMCLGGSRWRSKYLGSSHPHRKHRWSSNSWLQDSNTNYTKEDTEMEYNYLSRYSTSLVIMETWWDDDYASITMDWRKTTDNTKCEKKVQLYLSYIASGNEEWYCQSKLWKWS